MRKNFFVGWCLLRFSLHFTLQLAEHDEFVRFGLFAPAIDFKIAQNECALAIPFQENEWIGRPKFRRIKHVRISVAGGDDQPGCFVLSFAHSVFGVYLRSPFTLVIPSTTGTSTLARACSC